MSSVTGKVLARKAPRHHARNARWLREPKREHLARPGAVAPTFNHSSPRAGRIHLYMYGRGVHLAREAGPRAAGGRPAPRARPYFAVGFVFFVGVFAFSGCVV